MRRVEIRYCRSIANFAVIFYSISLLKTNRKYEYSIVKKNKHEIIRLEYYMYDAFLFSSRKAHEDSISKKSLVPEMPSMKVNESCSETTRQSSEAKIKQQDQSEPPKLTFHLTGGLFRGNLQAFKSFFFYLHSKSKTSNNRTLAVLVHSLNKPKKTQFF